MSQDKLTTLYFVSSSENKYEDYRFLLGRYADLHWVRMIIEEPKTMNLDILIRRKIEAVKPFLPHLPFLVEQTGLIIRAWKDLPGNLSGMFIDAVGNAGICRMLKSYPDKSDRVATVVTDLGYHGPGGQVEVFRGEVSGSIADTPRGDDGWGWEAIFIPEGHDETFGEMTPNARYRLSTRTLAVNDFYSSVLGYAQANEVAQNRIHLRQLILRYFNKSELRDLCFDIGLDPEDVLPDATKKEQVRELILYCDRHTLMPDLLTTCRALRPNADWPEFA
jgi:XTP/dITP diphosphohydrolase